MDSFLSKVNNMKHWRAYRNVEMVISTLIILGITRLWMKYAVHPKVSILVGIFFLILNGVRFFWPERSEKFFLWMIRYRWILAGILFVIMVGLHLHGSSMAAYDEILYDKADQNGILFGKARAIRTDEYAVQVSYFFSQYYNRFRTVSHQMSLTGQNMIIGYNSPVLDLTLAGKPFVWGYLLFGNEIGLSWYWCSKTILGLLAAFEMFRILIRDDRLAVFGSFFMIYSPAVQWWFAPHMYDVIFWSMAVFVTGYYFFTVRGKLKKLLTVILAVCVLVGFIVALFPSLQVALGLLSLLLLFACLMRDRENIDFQKRDVFRIIAVMVAVLLIVGHFVLQASDAIKALSNTVYPGKRVVTGGNFNLESLFQNLNLAVTPYETPQINNECELSNFNHLGVLCLLLYPYTFYVRRKKYGKKDRYLWIGGALFAAQLIQIEFMLIGFPVWLAKITLFSYINRMDLAYGFTAAIFTIWTIRCVIDNLPLYRAKYLAVILAIFGCGCIFTCIRMIDPKYAAILPLGSGFYGILALLFVFLGGMLLIGWHRYLIVLLTGWMAVTSFFVNPISRGIDALTERAFVRAACEINAEEPGIWITEGSWWEQDILLANGLQVLNAVNYYPDTEKWKILDPTGENSDIYNRYAHIRFDITDTSATFVSDFPDRVRVELPASELSDLGVDYILAPEDIHAYFDEAGLQYETVYHGGQYYIYKIVKN